MFLSTLGFALLTMLSPTSPHSTVVVFELIAGLGIGMVFQPPLIALQALVSNDDVAVATSLFGFIRSLSTSVSIVIGGLVFQNRMQAHHGFLKGVLSSAQADLFSGKNAAANVDLIDSLDNTQQAIVKEVYAMSLSTMWILYASVAGVGLVLSFGLDKKALKKSPMDNEEKARE